MKKIFVLLLVVIVTLGLVACEAPAGSSGKSGDLITVGFAQCKADESDWRKANTKSVQEALSNSNGFDLILADSNNDAAKQVSDVQGFIDQEVEYIIIAAVNVDGWDTVLKNDTVTGSGYPTLTPGENKLILGGGVTSLSVFPRWCTL